MTPMDPYALPVRREGRLKAAMRVLRSFAHDEAGAATFEFFLLAAFCGATSIVVLEAIGLSLFDAFGGVGRN